MTLTPERMKELEAMGVPEGVRPPVQLSGENGNAFNLVGVVMRALQREGLHDEAEELNRVYWSCESYEELLALLDEYVDVV